MLILKYNSVIFVCLQVVFCFCLVYVANATSIAEPFQFYEIVSDVVDEKPSLVLKITYPENVNVNLGNELTPTQVKDKPTVKFDSEENAFYTLVMIDPDAPSRKDPKYREVLHWLVGNIPGNKVSQGETIVDYIGSGPPQGTGLHRYVFLVFKQPENLTFNEQRVTNKSRDTRLQFSIRKFAQKYNLSNPIFGNMYQAQYDDYVPTLHKQLDN